MIMKQATCMAIMVSLALPGMANAQARLAEAAIAPPISVEPLPVDEAESPGQAKPLAGRGDQRILSRNDLYNRERAAEGRVGVRLGSDLSFRIGGN